MALETARFWIIWSGSSEVWPANWPTNWPSISRYLKPTLANISQKLETLQIWKSGSTLKTESVVFGFPGSQSGAGWTTGGSRWGGPRWTTVDHGGAGGAGGAVTALVFTQFSTGKWQLPQTCVICLEFGLTLRMFEDEGFKEWINVAWLRIFEDCMRR